MTRWAYLIGGVLLVLQANSYAEQAADWLAKMDAAVGELSYRGEFMRLQGAHTERLKIIHRAKVGDIRERLVAMDGVQREILRNQDEVQVVLPDHKSIVVEPLRHLSALSQTLPAFSNRALERWYRLDVDDMQQPRVLGRRVRLVSVLPVDEYRYGYRFWLDQANGFPLRTELVDADEHTLEQMVFTQIEFTDEISDQALLPDYTLAEFEIYKSALPVQQANRLLAAQRAAHQAQQGAWQLANLPQGFEVVQWRVGSEQRGGWQEHYVLSDGLATVSVFVQFATSAKPQPLPTRPGVGQVFSVVKQDTPIHVMGEVPYATVEMIGQAIRPASR